MKDELVIGCNYPDGYSAVFEQDHATVYLYALKDGETLKENRGTTDMEWLAGFDYQAAPNSNGATRAFITCD